MLVVCAYDPEMRIPLIPLLSMSALALAACGVQEEFPAAAIGADTVVVARIDPASMRTGMVRDSLDAMADIAGRSTNPQIVQLSGLMRLQSLSIDDSTPQPIDAAMQSLVEAGATSIWVVVPESAMPGSGGAFAEALGGNAQSLLGYGSVVVQAKSRDAGPAIESAMRMLGGPASDCTANAIVPGWFSIRTKGSPALPTAGSADAARSFSSAALAHSGASVTAAMRMTDSMRSALSSDDEMMLQAQMMVGRVMTSLERLQMLTASATFGTEPVIRAGMAFGDADDAAEFNAAWNETLETILGFIQMQSMMAAMGEDGDGAPAPKPPQWGPVFEGLKMRQDGAALSLTIDRERMRSMMR